MDNNYYHVTFNLSNGKSRTIEDVEAYAADAAITNAKTSQKDGKIYLEIENYMYEINEDHLVEVVVEKVDSPEERIKQAQKTAEALGKMSF